MNVRGGLRCGGRHNLSPEGKNKLELSDTPDVRRLTTRRVYVSGASARATRRQRFVMDNLHYLLYGAVGQKNRNASRLHVRWVSSPQKTNYDMILGKLPVYKSPTHPIIYKSPGSKTF